MNESTFTTPWGVTVRAVAREGTVDWNTLYSCIAEDEYRLARIPDRGVAIDVGGYVAGCSLALATKGYKVYMVEPLPENVMIARENVELNNFDAQIKIYDRAMTAGTNTTHPIYYYETASELGKQHEYIGIPHKDGRAGKVIQVPTVTIEQIFEENKIDQCNFLKVDIEGGEWDIFENIPEHILDKIDRIAIEMDGTTEKPTSTTEFLKLLKGKFTDHSRGYFPDWCAPGTSVHGFYINKRI